VTDVYNSAFEEIQGLLQTFVSTKAKVAQMYKKNIALALLEIHFRIPKTLHANDAGPDGLTPRVKQMCLFLDQNYDRLSAFDDLKGYVTELTFEEAKYFVEEMIPKLAGDVGVLPSIAYVSWDLLITPLTAGYDNERNLAESAGAQVQICPHNLPTNTLRTTIGH
jgi:hypothetical protein